MKTKGRRTSDNITDLRPGAKGGRPKPTPKRTLPAELKGTNRMLSTLTIEAARATPEIGRLAKMRRAEKAIREWQASKRKKPKG